MADNRTITHKFAQRHEHGPQTGSNIYYEFIGPFPVIYSYGPHFPMAVQGEIGTNFYLWYEASYSATTGKHQSYTAGALSHKDRITVFSRPTSYIIDGELKATKDRKQADLQGYEAKIRELAGKHNRARVHSYESEIADWLEQAARYVELFKAGNYASGPIREFIRSEMNAETFVWEIIDGLGEKDTEARQRVKEQRERRRKTEIEMFRAGESDSISGKYAYLRLDGNTVVTSKGIRLDADSAREAAGRLKDVVQRGEKMSWQLFNVDGWPINSVTEAGDIIAGCHYVQRSEFERFIEMELNA